MVLGIKRLIRYFFFAVVTIIVQKECCDIITLTFIFLNPHVDLFLEL